MTRSLGGRVAIVFGDRATRNSRIDAACVTGSRVCAESIMFYPPGIPLLMPGEVVTGEILHVCQSLLAGGAHCYAADPTLGTIRVVGDS